MTRTAPKILMLLDNPFVSDSRVFKEASSFIEAGFQVKVLCQTSAALDETEVRQGILIERCFNDFFKSPFSKTYKTQSQLLVKKILSEDFDILHCHDFFLLPIADRVKKQRPNIFLTYDSHEYLKGWPYYKELKSPLNRLKGRLVWERLLQLEKKHSQQINCLLGPSKGIVEAQVKRLKLKVSGLAVRNIPIIQEQTPDKPSLNRKDEKLQIVHSGSIYMPDNFLNELIEWIKHRNNFNLLFIGNRPIHKHLAEKYKNHPNLRFADYIESDLHRQLSTSDIGIIYTRANSYPAHKLGSSNKLMEYGLAGLPTVGTEQLAHQELNEEFDHMELFKPENIKSFKEAIQRMIDTLSEKRKNAERIKYSLSWETEFRPVVELYKKVAARKGYNI